MIERLKRFFYDLANFHAYQLIKHSLVYGIGDIIQRSLSIVLLPLYTRYLSPSDYGVISLLAVFGMITGTVTMCGLTNGIGRFFYYTEQENASLPEIVWSPFLFVAIETLVVIALLSALSQQLSAILFDSKKFTYTVVLTLIGVFIGNLSGVGRSILIYQEKAMTVNYINIAGVIIGIISGLFFVVILKRGVTGAVEAGLVSSAFICIPILFLTVARLRPVFSNIILRKQLKFSLPLVAASFAFILIDSSDRYLLKIFLPLSEVGLYNVGYSVGLVMMIIVGGFTLAWPPFYHKNNQNNEGQTICDDILKIYLLVTVFCVVTLSLFAPIAIKLLTTERFYQSYTVVPWVAMAYLLKGPYIIFLMGLYIKNKTGWQLYIEGSAAVANIGLNIILIPIMGREAAAVTTLISYLIMVVGAYLMAMRVNPIPKISWGYISKIIVPAFVISIFCRWSADSDNYLIISIGLFLCFSTLIGFMSYKEIIPLIKKQIRYA